MPNCGQPSHLRLAEPADEADTCAGTALTPKQQRFVAEYLIDLNGTQAAIRAGYAQAGASVEAHRLLRNAKIAAAIDQEMARNPGVTRVRIVDELARIGFANAQEAGDGIKVGDRLTALDKLGRATGLFKERVEVGGANGGPIETLEHSDSKLAMALLALIHREAG